MRLDLHPTIEGERWTLAGLFEDPTAADVKAREATENGKFAARWTIEAPDGMTLAALATRGQTRRQRRARLPHGKDAAQWMAAVAIETFRAVERSARAQKLDFRWYKELDEARLLEAIRRWTWNGTVLDVVGALVSDLILAHPFPNGNHRTATTIGREFIASVGVDWPPYDLRGKGYLRYRRDTEPFFVQSKYILALRRHRSVLLVALRHGYREVEVRRGLTQPLRREHVDMNEKESRRLHRQTLSNMFLRIAAPRDASKLSEPHVGGLRRFVEYELGHGL